MLNCTDLACVLHHHHFYAHLHQIHHLPTDHEHYHHDNSEVGNGSDIENEESINNLINEDSEISGLLHVDAPNEIIWMICGVVIAMLLVGLIIILVAVTINKLRKRDDTSAVIPSSNSRHQLDGHLQQQQQQQHINQAYVNNHHNNINSYQHSNQHHQITTTVATITSQQQVLTNENGIIQNNNSMYIKEQQQQLQQQDNGWVFPPLPPQPNIYCMNTADALAHLQDKSGFKRFRTQFSGRFKRFVAKKNQEPPVIPPELRPQLKTIYVY